MNKSLLFLLLLTTFQIYAQENFNSESYQTTLGDLTTNSYKKDSTANALVIYESGNSYVSKSDFKLKTEIKHKIKILTQEGFDQANVVIYLYNKNGSSERATNILATTYNLVNGKVVSTKLKESDIFREKYDENHTLIKFTLPNIKVGSVITYGYKLSSPYMFKYHGWEFQSDIPKLYSQYDTSIPGYWKYHIKLVGGKKLSLSNSSLEKSCLEVGNGGYADCSIGSYGMKNIPAFIEEDYSTTKQNYLARIEYELESFTNPSGAITHYTKSWDDVDKELRTDKNIGKQLKKSISLKDFLDPSIINETDALKKAEAIYKYVQTNYTWDGEFKIFSTVSIKDLIESKSGNISSINILLHNLLNEAGIDTKPVFLSTRNNGFPTYIYPVISDYNYIIMQATINNKPYLLDATDKDLCFGQIPFMCLNQNGRLFDFKNESKWIDLEPNSQTSTNYIVEMNLDENNKLIGTISSKKTGYHAINSKKDYLKSEDSYLDALEKTHINSDISEFKATINDGTNPDFQETYKINHEIEDVAGNIYLNPFLIQFFNENPFKLQERTYPIDFGYPDIYFYNLTIKINNGYTIKEIPKDVTIKLPNKSGECLFSTTKVDNTLNMSLKISFNNAIYETGYYDFLKDFMNQIVDIQNNSIILLSKSE